MRLLVLFVALRGLAATTAVAQQPDAFSAGVLLPACRGFAEYTAVVPEPEVAFREGVCVGIFSAMLSYGLMYDPSLRYCAPKDAGIRQAIQFVVRGVDSQPNLLHEDLRGVIVAILRHSWPCPG
jgi:hypothetical protein